VECVCSDVTAAHYYFTFLVVFTVMERYTIRHKLIHARKLVPLFNGWNEKDNGNAERSRQEDIRQREFYKDEKKKLLDKGIISRL